MSVVFDRLKEMKGNQMIKENLEIDFILDFYDIVDECGCSENLWCSDCFNGTY